MRVMFRALAGSLGLALCLTACGGGSGTSALPTPANPTSSNASNPTTPTTASATRAPLGLVPQPSGVFAAAERGRRAASAPVHISMMLQYNNQAQLDQLVADQANPASGR